MVESARVRRLFAGIAIALICLIVAAIVIARQAQPMAPTGDTAVLESYTRMASEGRLLVGPYSRFQWHHPGPIYFYVLSPFYAASGHHTAGLNAAAVAINLSLLTASVVIAATSGGPILAVTVASVSAFYVFRLPDLLVSVWNPHIVVLPLVATALLCAAAAAGRAWLLPLAALAASFVAQTAVGVLPAAVLLGVASFGAVSSAAFRDEAIRRRYGAVALATVVVAALAWMLPLVEQTTGSPGNLAALWSFFAAGGAGQPFRVAFAAWAAMLSGLVRPDFYLAHGWVLRLNHNGWAEGWAIGQMMLLACSAVLSIRRQFQLYLSAFLFATSLLALWSVTRIEGEIMDHEIFWISGLGLVNIAVVADAIISTLVPRGVLSSMFSAHAAAITCGVLVMFCAAAGLSQLNAIRAQSLAPSVETTAIQHVARDVQVYLQRENVGRPLVKIDQDSWGLAAGVLLQMQKAGVAYAVDEDWLPMFTEAARATGQESAVLSISGATRHVILRGQPGTVAVAASDPVFADALPPTAGVGRR
jgi:hypothetical protein